jgi:hypothetical protein
MCLSLEWIAHIIIVAIVIGAAILILKVVLPDWLGPKWIAVLDIVVKAAIAIFVVIVVFELLACLAWPSLRHY